MLQEMTLTWGIENYYTVVHFTRCWRSGVDESDEYICDDDMDNMINDINVESFFMPDEFEKVWGDAMWVLCQMSLKRYGVMQSGYYVMKYIYYVFLTLLPYCYFSFMIVV